MHARSLIRAFEVRTHHIWTLRKKQVQKMGGAMALGKFPVPGRPTIWMIVGQGPAALAVSAVVGVVWTFYSHLSFLSCLPLFGRFFWLVVWI